jgi:hypothetical protein
MWRIERRCRKPKSSVDAVILALLGWATADSLLLTAVEEQARRSPRRGTLGPDPTATPPRILVS